MMIFSFPRFTSLSRFLCRRLPARPGKFRVQRFPNGELYLTLGSMVKRQHCVIVGSIAPPDPQLLSLLLLAHTLHKEGASQITLVLLYLAYDRQDKDVPAESMATPWLGNLLKASHVSRIITVDVHSQKAVQQLGVSVVSLSAAAILAPAIRRYGLTAATLVAPDRGALPVCRRLQQALGTAGPIAYFKKMRTHAGVTVSNLRGSVGYQAILVDDMLDTGGTLVQCAKKLRTTGVREIYVAVTQGLFTGEKWKQLWKLGVKHIWCTDTIPPSAAIQQEKRITVVSVAPLLLEQLRHTH